MDAEPEPRWHRRYGFVTTNDSGITKGVMSLTTVMVAHGG